MTKRHFSESQFQKKAMEYLKDKGIYHINIYGSGRTAKGAPDIIACIKGKFVAFELKVGKNKPQPDQIIHERRIKRSGGLHYYPYNMAEFTKIVDSLIG